MISSMTLISILSLILSISPVQAEISSFKPAEMDEELRKVPEDMVFVKGGCFQMGDIFRNVSSSEKPVHEVCVDNFYIRRYEVTVGEFRTFVNETGYRTEAEKQDGCHGWMGDREEKKRDYNWRNAGFPQTERDPVVCVSWNDANEYIRWLSKKEGKNYRLPTEAEWEYAARSGGKKYKYSWGNGEPSGNIADESAKKELSGVSIWKGYDDGYAYTAPVGNFKPNELGLHDMSGNVYEWVSDWHGEGYYKNSPKHNPRGPGSGESKLLRGGSWDLEPGTALSSSRYWNMPGARAVCMGFRSAL